jgi:prepilin-type N-terminal cleavage/methylation domain-containing protein
MHTKERAFSTIELLTVIAIMGILASVTVVGVSHMRVSARIKAVEGLMEGARTGAIGCLARGRALEDRIDRGIMCGTDGLRWPDLPGPWTYETPTADISDISSRTFSFSATGDGATVICTEDACSTS